MVLWDCKGFSLGRDSCKASRGSGGENESRSAEAMGKDSMGGGTACAEVTGSVQQGAWSRESNWVLVWKEAGQAAQGWKGLEHRVKNSGLFWETQLTRVRSLGSGDCLGSNPGCVAFSKLLNFSVSPFFNLYNGYAIIMCLQVVVRISTWLWTMSAASELNECNPLVFPSSPAKPPNQLQYKRKQGVWSIPTPHLPRLQALLRRHTKGASTWKGPSLRVKCSGF